MKATHRLERGYEHLTADERFELMIAAAARADADEQARLVRSCPRRTYTVADREFVRLYEDAHALTIGVAADLVAVAARIAALDAALIEGRVSFARACDEAEHEACVATGEEQQLAVRRAVRREQGRFRRTVRVARLSLMTEGATIAGAFAALCSDEMHLEPTQLIAAVAPTFADVFALFVGAPAPDHAIEARTAEMAAAWRTSRSKS